MSFKNPAPPEKFVATCIRVVLTMPESRLTVVTNFLISVGVLALVWSGDVNGSVGVFGVVAINGVTSGLLYSFGKALEEAESRQERP